MTMLTALTARLPPLLPLDIAPELPPTFTVNGRVYVPWIEGVEVIRAPTETAYNVTPRQTARGRTWPSGSGKPKPIQMTVTLRFEASTALAVARLAQRWRRVLLSCTAYTEGARSVYPIGVMSATEAAGEGLTRTVSVTWLLFDARWRLSPDDLFPTDHPVESSPGLYPLGLLQVEDGGTGYFDVSPLGDAAFSNPATLELTSSSGQTYTFTTVGIEVPEP
ncbi:hypothetical protein [Deinococcus kurensis]|uniref:hypothetical protein n=1 Tax=Deinococcus kurensis TaxID=2662757 RepID=UPI0012D2D421|nr:hypothetical protein [Deinococcus kurensis]